MSIIKIKVKDGIIDIDYDVICLSSVLNELYKKNNLELKNIHYRTMRKIVEYLSFQYEKINGKTQKYYNNIEWSNSFLNVSLDELCEIANASYDLKLNDLRELIEVKIYSYIIIETSKKDKEKIIYA